MEVLAIEETLWHRCLESWLVAHETLGASNHKCESSSDVSTDRNRGEHGTSSVVRNTYGTLQWSHHSDKVESIYKGADWNSSILWKPFQ